jgi:predicted small integral membrane protein
MAKQKISNVSITLGTLSIILGLIIPGIGLLLGIIGICLKKPANKYNKAVALNVIGICVSIISWVFWTTMLLAMWSF